MDQDIYEARLADHRTDDGRYGPTSARPGEVMCHRANQEGGRWGPWVCTRRYSHDGPHVAHAGGAGEVMAIWFTRYPDADLDLDAGL